MGLYLNSQKRRFDPYGSCADDSVSFIHRQMLKKYLLLLPFNGRMGISPTHLTKQFKLPLFVHDFLAFDLVFFFGYKAVLFQTFEFAQFCLKVGGDILIRGHVVLYDPE